jgi:hypothetical protein
MLKWQVVDRRWHNTTAYGFGTGLNPITSSRKVGAQNKACLRLSKSVDTVSGLLFIMITP